MESPRHIYACNRVCRRCGCRISKSHTKISDQLRGLYLNQWNVDLRLDPIGWPTVLCSTCASQLSRLQKATDGSGPPPNRVNEQFSFRRWPSTRGSTIAHTDDSCDICSEAYRWSSQKCGRRSKVKSGKCTQPRHGQMARLCAKCFSAIGPGRHHICSKRRAADNADRLLQQRGVDGEVAGRSIRRYADSDSTSSTLPAFGHSRKIYMKPKPTRATADIDTLIALKQSGPGMSDRHTDRIRKALRKVCKFPSMKTYDKVKKDTLDDLFEAVLVPMRRAKGKYDFSLTPTCVIRCTNVIELINRYQPHRWGQRFEVFFDENVE